jgi:cyclopropane fatty-acyl-phospholipid synthase-like methyltransferase
MNKNKLRNLNPIQRQKEGVSSLHMYDAQLVFDKLHLAKGDVFVDLGCGAGDHSFIAAQHVGRKGMVYALDRWPEAISKIEDKVSSRSIKNIKPISSDITKALPINDESADVCFMATVLHCIASGEDREYLCKEISRILKPDGKIAILEIKKQKTSFGPSVEMRLSAEEIENIFKPYGFIKVDLTDLGNFYLIILKHNYM